MARSPAELAQSGRAARALPLALLYKHLSHPDGIVGIMIMADRRDVTPQPTISFTPEEARWLHLTLESSKRVVANALFERGIRPTEDRMYKAYDLLAERCLAFSIVQQDPDK